MTKPAKPMRTKSIVLSKKRLTSWLKTRYEPPRGKTNNLHMRKQSRRSASVTAKLISAFVFATRIVQFLFYLNPKFQASSSFLCLYRSVCVGPGRKPHCWFSHEVAHMLDFPMMILNENAPYCSRFWLIMLTCQ